MNELALMAGYIAGAFVFAALIWYANRHVQDVIQRDLAPVILGALWPLFAILVICVGLLYGALRLVHLVFGIRKDTP